jgi:protein-L-isoaspartate(D-aspartate) O-methyltransferase
MLSDTYKHKGLRAALIKSLEKKGITDQAVLKAMMQVPRHFFLDTAFLIHAYEDKAFSIGEGQTISQPYTVAFQTQLLEIKPREKILEIGTGSGYQSSILMAMGAQLYTIEYNQNLYRKARQKFQLLGYQPVMQCGDGSKGMPAFAPFHKILVTAGAPSIPASLTAQLAVGGSLVIPVGDLQNQEMLKIVKTDEGQFKVYRHGDFAFVKLMGDEGWGK